MKVAGSFKSVHFFETNTFREYKCLENISKTTINSVLPVEQCSSIYFGDSNGIITKYNVEDLVK